MGVVGKLQHDSPTAFYFIIHAFLSSLRVTRKMSTPFKNESDVFENSEVPSLKFLLLYKVSEFITKRVFFINF